MVAAASRFTSGGNATFNGMARGRSGSMTTSALIAPPSRVTRGMAFTSAGVSSWYREKPASRRRAELEARCGLISYLTLAARVTHISFRTQELDYLQACKIAWIDDLVRSYIWEEILTFRAFMSPCRQSWRQKTTDELTMHEVIERPLFSASRFSVPGMKSAASGT